ncbi:hypothetical protein SUGI_0847760 [Cryptomeria japonica]|nr:hypothetical protein SUGI_0847760 [Cryptomeria japonica]
MSPSASVVPQIAFPSNNGRFISWSSHLVDRSCKPWHKGFVKGGACSFSEALCSGSRVRNASHLAPPQKLNPRSPPQYRSILQHETLGFSQGVPHGPTVSVSHSTVIPKICLHNLASDKEAFLQDCALICRFTKIWPKLSDLCAWI